MIASIIFRGLLIAIPFAHSVILFRSGHWELAFMEHLVVVGLLLWGTLKPNSRLFGPIESEADEGFRLTLDDGPDPSTTPAILDLLDKYETRAIFFLIGQRAERHPELVREIQKRGHKIGNHTWSHPQASFWIAGPWRTYREISRCQDCLTEILGEMPKVFRAPVGHSNLWVHPILRTLDLQLMGWNCRGFDAVERSAEVALNKITSEMKESSLVLAHEATPIAVEVVEGILEKARSL